MRTKDNYDTKTNVRNMKWEELLPDVLMSVQQTFQTRINRNDHNTYNEVNKVDGALTI